MSVTLAD